MHCKLLACCILVTAITSHNAAAKNIFEKAADAAADVDPTNKNSAVRKEADKAGKELAKLDPSKALREEWKRAQKAALAGLPKLDPSQVKRQLQNALLQQIERQAGASYNTQSGRFDLRNTAMGRQLSSLLRNFSQGNKRSSSVDEFYYVPASRELVLNARARHCQSWGKIIPGLGPVDLYDLTQTAFVRVDFKNSKVEYKIQVGPYAPKIHSGMNDMSDGNIIAAVQASVPDVVGKAMHHEESDQYDEVKRRYGSKYGEQNVYFASKQFVNWATPETAGNYVVNGIVTLGTSVYPQIMSDLRKRAQDELPQLSQWLEQRGMNNAQAVAQELLTGRQPRWPFLKFEMTPVRYASRNKPLNAVATPWFKVDHLAFVIVWQNDPSKIASTIGSNTMPSKPNTTTPTWPNKRPRLRPTSSDTASDDVFGPSSGSTTTTVLRPNPDEPRTQNGVRIGTLQLMNDYSGDCEIQLFHPADPNRVFQRIRLPSRASLSVQREGKPITIGADWRVKIRFGNGAESQVSTIEQVADYRGNRWVIQATKLWR